MNSAHTDRGPFSTCLHAVSSPTIDIGKISKEFPKRVGILILSVQTKLGSKLQSYCCTNITDNEIKSNFEKLHSLLGNPYTNLKSRSLEKLKSQQQQSFVTIGHNSFHICCTRPYNCNC